ncbi:MAG TPA: twin-arginine translocation pathway signal [Afipia sp.]
MPVVVMVRRDIKKAAPLAALLLAGALLGGCATGATSSVFVDPSRYELYNCDQLNKARKPVFERVTELQALMAKAETGAAGGLISGLAYQTDFLKARAELNLIDETRQHGNCGALVPDAPAVSTAAAPAKKRKRAQ